MDNDESEGSLESVVELSDSNDESAKTFIVPIPGNLKKKRSSPSNSLTLKPSSSFTYAGVSASNTTAGPWDSAEDIPSSLLNKLIEQLTRQRWVVPVLPKQELETLMEISVSLIKKGTDGSSINFQKFLNEALVLSFEKVMQDEAMRDWKLDIHRCIWLRIEKFFLMFTKKLRQTLDSNRIPSAFWKVLRLTMSSTSRYYIQNASMDLASLNVDYNFPEMEVCFKVWLRLLLIRFSSMGGFELMKLFFENNVGKDTPFTSIIEWLSPFTSCVSFLKPEFINDIFRHVLDVSLNRLRQLDVETFKCETVKGDLHDSPYMELPILLQMFFALIPSSVAEAKELTFFCLKYVLRYIILVLQVAPFAGRIAALEELHSILLNASCDLMMSRKAMEPTLEELAVWLREQSFLEILFRDNLHQLSFCERIERILRVLLTNNAITVQELEIIWNVQKGKHDAIQRNLYDLLAKLINSFTNELQEHLFSLMKESWGESSPRERTLLLDLIRRIGIDFCTVSEKNLTLQSLSLLWDLFRDERLPVEVGNAALEAHFTILESLSCSNILYRRYIDKCIEELIADSG
uniref:Ubiquitinyl hydrolase 1 n=1 Tax=Syphacia muris TaxID=451379 RepID=A0A0N5A8R0_9BILA